MEAYNHNHDIVEKRRASLKSLTFEERLDRDKILHLILAARGIEGKLNVNKHALENPLSAAYLYNKASELYKSCLDNACTRLAYNEVTYPILLRSELRALENAKFRAGHEATRSIMLELNAKIDERSAQIHNALGQDCQERESLEGARQAYAEILKKHKYQMFSSPQRMEEHAQVQAKLVLISMRIMQLEKIKRPK